MADSQMENKQWQCSTQFVSTIAYLNTANVHIFLHAEFFAMTALWKQNIVGICRFFFVFKH